MTSFFHSARILILGCQHGSGAGSLPGITNNYPIVPYVHIMSTYGENKKKYLFCCYKLQPYWIKTSFNLNSFLETVSLNIITLDFKILTREFV